MNKIRILFSISGIACIFNYAIADCQMVVSVNTDISSNSTIAINYVAEGPNADRDPTEIAGGRRSVVHRVPCENFYTLRASEQKARLTADELDAPTITAGVCTYRFNPLFFSRENDSRNISFPDDFVCPDNPYRNIN